MNIYLFNFKDIFLNFFIYKLKFKLNIIYINKILILKSKKYYIN